MPSDRQQWVILRHAPGMTDDAFHALLAEFGSPGEALEAGERRLAETAGVSRRLAEHIASMHERVDGILDGLAEMESLGLNYVVMDDDGYPAALSVENNPPPLLWVRGALPPAQTPTVSVVGSRETSAVAAATARRLGELLVGMRVAVVSGMAAGIDTVVHEGVAQKEGIGIGVPGCGVAALAPDAVAELGAKLVRRGAVASPFPPYSGTSGARMKARRRLIAAWGQVMVVVFARPSGGACDTALQALGMGRKVLVMRWTGEQRHRFLTDRGADPIAPHADEAADLVREALVDWSPDSAAAVSQAPKQLRLF